MKQFALNSAAILTILLTSCAQITNNNCIKPTLYITSEKIIRKIKDYEEKNGPPANFHGCYDVFPYFQEAVANDDFEIVKFLVEHGANMTRTSIDMLYFDRPEYHLTIDNVLARAKSVRMAEYLVKHGANINQGTGVFFETLLWNAAMAGDFELVKFCVQNGANINQEYCGWMGEGMVSTTALEAACSKPDKLNTSDGVCSNPEYMKIIKFLVAHGALINRPYSYENSALTRAVRAKNKEVVRFLLKHGATINTQTILERPITQAEIDQLR